MANTVKELLADPVKGINRAQGILCYLFRDALLWRQVNPSTWNKRLQLYFKKPHNEDDQDRGNLNKELIRDDFTWSNFKKSIDFLNTVSATLTIALTWASGKVSRYHVVIDPAEDESDAALDTFVEQEVSDVFAHRKRPISTLARLYRKIITEEQINASKWEALLDAWVKNPHNGIDQTHRGISQAKTSLTRELTDNRMTWNVFRKGLLILNPVQQEYLLELRWSKELGDASIHQVTIRDPLSMITGADNKAGS